MDLIYCDLQLLINTHKKLLLRIALFKTAMIDIKMSSVPNEKRGVNREDFPYSFSNEMKK